MELSGRPGPAAFYSPKWGRSADKYNLTWKIDSYPPLEEVRLLYRRVLVGNLVIKWLTRRYFLSFINPFR